MVIVSLLLTKQMNMKGISYLQVQGLSSNNVAADLGQGLLELALQVFAAHHLGSLRHLSQSLFQPAEDTDQATFIDIGHFAGIVSTPGRRLEGGNGAKDLPDLCKRLALCPVVNDLHQLPVEALHVLILIDGHLRLLRHLGNDAGL